ncbi:MAG TPA: amidohydrolase family protein [Phycisphaerae bacterium]|nr:amidohydrolase family protein [Phycisphaerae bacterium]
MSFYFRIPHSHFRIYASPMVIDVHCHVGYSARRIDPALPRFTFEKNGAPGAPGFDSYLSPRLLSRFAWFFIRRWLGIPRGLKAGDEFDALLEKVYDRHWSAAPGIDRFVLLAFDEYHADAGRVLGPSQRRGQVGSDLYVSNTLVRALCMARPDRYLFGASLHPYRTEGDRDAASMLEELSAAGAVLIKWLPIHQNIRAEDPRTVAFLRAAARLKMPMLIHYGGEMSLARQHMEFEHPGPMLDVLRRLRADGEMPTVIVAHAATPSFIFQSADGHRRLIEALLGEFADAPIYADISALAAFGRTPWLKRLAANKAVHKKLLFATDFPIPVMLRSFRRLMDAETYARIAADPSWAHQDLLLKQALGFDPCVFTQARSVLNINAESA